MSATRVPFGRNRGRLLQEVPDDYLAWLHSLENLREPLRTNVALEYRRRFGDVLTGREPLPPELRDVAARLVSAGYHVLAKTAHPDAGGTNDQMRELSAAAEALRRLVIP